MQTSFRAGRASFDQVLSYGFPIRHLLLWLMPNFYGNPAHHTYFDLFAWSTLPVNTASGHTEWGIKNYVEGGAYVGIITLIFAAIAVAAAIRTLARRFSRQTAPSVNGPANEGVTSPTWFFVVLGLFSIAFIFGTPLYAILYYGLPGINQLNSPFRWVYALTLCLVALAATGMEAVVRSQRREVRSEKQEAKDKRQGDGRRTTDDRKPIPSLSKGLSYVLIAAGVIILAGLVAVRLAWPAFEPLVNRIYLSMAKAAEGFTSAQMFFSYEARNAAVLGLLLLGCGILLAMAFRYARRAWWSIAVIGLLAVELCVAWTGFNPSVDPQLLAYTPPAIEFLQRDRSLWRVTSYDPTGEKPLNANIPWLFNLQDVRGYDSIIPKQYTTYMGLVEPQNELMFNRVAPLSDRRSLESPLIDLLGVKYIVTTASIDTPGYTLAYDDIAAGGQTRIYQNQRAMPRAFTLPITSSLLTDDFARAVQEKDPRQFVMIDATCGITDTGCALPFPASYAPATITSYKNNEVWIDAQIGQPSWLILTDSYFPGWKAFVRPLGGSDDQEREVPIGLANGNFRAVRLEAGGQTTDDGRRTTEQLTQDSDSALSTQHSAHPWATPCASATRPVRSWSARSPRSWH